MPGPKAISKSPTCRARCIAIVVASMEGGGAERVALNLAEEFTEQGVEVDLVVISATGPLLAQVPHQVRIVPLGGGGRARNSVGKLRHYLRRSNPSAVLSVAFHVNLLTALATLGLRHRPRLVLSVHGTFSRALRTHPFVKRLWLTVATMLLYRLADSVVAVSTGAARDLGRQARLDPDKIVTIYNPVIRKDFDELVAQQPDHPWVNADGLPLVVAAGRLNRAKDYPTLIRAFGRVAKKSGARLLILGEGDLRVELEEMVAQLGLGASVALVGFVSNPLSYMRAADVFVLSSRWEGLPTVLIEAMASGTPVVSTDCPNGPREILENGKWGALVPVADPEALAEQILSSLKQGGVDARVRALDFRVSPIATQYLALMLP